MLRFFVIFPKDIAWKILKYEILKVFTMKIRIIYNSGMFFYARKISTVINPRLLLEVLTQFWIGTSGKFMLEVLNGG